MPPGKAIAANEAQAKADADKAAAAEAEANKDWTAEYERTGSRVDYAKALLKSLGAQFTTGNIAFLTAIMRAEGTRAAFNPMASAQNAPGATAFNPPYSVKNYADAASSIAAVTGQWNRRFAQWAEHLRNDTTSQITSNDPLWGLYVNGTPGHDPSGYGKRVMSYFGGGVSDGTTNTTNDGTQIIGPTGSQVDSDHAEYAWLLDDPEVGPLLRYDAEHDLSQSEWDYRLHQTKWWKENSSSSRAWQITLNNDPASAKETIGQQTTLIKRVAASLGVELPELALLGYADQMMRFAWSDDQLRAAIVAGVKLTGNDKGKAGLSEQEARAAAEDYGIKLSDKSAADYATKSLTGLIDIETLRGDFAAQAQAMFPSVADSIKRGHTVRQILDPYLSSASQILGQEAAAMFNISDPKWLEPIQSKDSKGVMRQLSMADWNAKVMQDHRYQYDRTTNARNDAFALTQSLGQTFGAL